MCVFSWQNLSALNSFWTLKEKTRWPKSTQNPLNCRIQKNILHNMTVHCLKNIKEHNYSQFTRYDFLLPTHTSSLPTPIQTVSHRPLFQKLQLNFFFFENQTFMPATNFFLSFFTFTDNCSGLRKILRSFVCATTWRTWWTKVTTAEALYALISSYTIIADNYKPNYLLLLLLLLRRRLLQIQLEKQKQSALLNLHFL